MSVEEDERADGAPAKVGIVVRTKDRPLMLARALRDVAEQRFTNWTIVIVNDGGEEAAVERLIEEMPAVQRARVSVVHHERSQGRSAAANAGIRALGTEYVVLHDDDDLWHADFLQLATRWLDTHAEEVGVVARTEIVFESERNGRFAETGRIPFWPSLTGINYADLLQVNRFVPIAYLYRRAIHDEVGFYREDVHAAEDWEFNLRVAARHPIGFIGDRTLAYWMQRPHTDGNLGNSMFVLADEHEHFDRRIRDEALRAYVAAHGDGLPLFLARFVQEEIQRQLDSRRTLGQRFVGRLQRWRRGRLTR